MVPTTLQIQVGQYNPVLTELIVSTNETIDDVEWVLSMVQYLPYLFHWDYRHMKRIYHIQSYDVNIMINSLMKILLTPNLQSQLHQESVRHKWMRLYYEIVKYHISEQQERTDLNELLLAIIEKCKITELLMKSLISSKVTSKLILKMTHDA